MPLIDWLIISKLKQIIETRTTCSKWAAAAQSCRNNWQRKAGKLWQQQASPIIAQPSPLCQQTRSLWEDQSASSTPRSQSATLEVSTIHFFNARNDIISIVIVVAIHQTIYCFIFILHVFRCFVYSCPGRAYHGWLNHRGRRRILRQE